MLFVLKKEYIEHARLRALATSILNKDKGVEAFDEYRKEAFPWAENQQNRDKAGHIALLNEEVKKGALGIKPLWEAKTRVKSRMRHKIIEADELTKPRKSPEEMKNLYTKLGSVIP
jgi:hypothetical protein